TVALYSSFFFFFFLAELLSEWLPRWASFAIVFGIMLLVAGLCAFLGYQRARKIKAPERTIDSVKQTAAARRPEPSERPAWSELTAGGCGAGSGRVERARAGARGRPPGLRARHRAACRASGRCGRRAAGRRAARVRRLLVGVASADARAGRGRLSGGGRRPARLRRFGQAPTWLRRVDALR